MNPDLQLDTINAHHTLGIAMCMLRRLDQDIAAELAFKAMKAVEPGIIYYVDNVIPFRRMK